MSRQAETAPLSGGVPGGPGSGQEITGKGPGIKKKCCLFRAERPKFGIRRRRKRARVPGMIIR
ncbi:MAG: hypothetical protein DRH56_00920 [Deltaproteobacteria bacterium]|nr:MAG: hypothetical protein DRH56_00920 [Deltaproteobacteria bacterium]